ncbi:DUF3737 family protein [Vibrio furnissii]|uniref:DUF3737 family protein n=1 Tax=Vibrio furnissii TaxID=29494 RepID=UPI000200DB2A|nr:DUF3737 family protein [Vibrio furnissii]ADT89677.1 hypothetical protein vfu_B01507 [Vibrio furnissii NCTC 11218]
MKNVIQTQEKISDRFYEGERPLYAASNTFLHKVRFYPGESAMKHTHHMTAMQCEFMGKYPFWHSNHVLLEQSLFTVYARAAIWYTDHLTMKNCVVEETDLCFEYATLHAEIVSDIMSVKNPLSGYIKARSIGDIIIDEHSRDPKACIIET